MSLRARLEARREVAAKATPGPWDWDDISSDLINPTIIEREYGEFGSVLSEYPKPVLVGVYAPGDDDITHIAANDPTTITLMLDCLLAAERRREARGESEAEYRWNLNEAIRDEDDALLALHAHLEREGGE